jgi:hypothetical protein
MLMSTLRPALAALLFCSASTWGDELSDLRARNAQLEATVEELTLQLADALSERKDLEARLAQAIADRDGLEAELAAAAAARAGSASPMVAGDIPAAEVAGTTALAMDRDTVSEEAVMPEGDSVAAAAKLQREAQAGTPTRNEACDVEEALRGYKRSGKANRALGDWLRSSNHLKVCSTEQLTQIRKAVKFDFLGYEKEVLAMIDEELEAR